MTTTDPTTDPATELAALYPLMVKAGCWPEHMFVSLGTNGKTYWVLKYFEDSVPFALKAHHALSIARSAAEDWLRGRGWWPAEEWREYWRIDRGPDAPDLSLAAAIEDELGRTEG